LKQKIPLLLVETEEKMRVDVEGMEKGINCLKYLYFFCSSTFLDLRQNGSQIHDRKVISLMNIPMRRSK